jgi:hypothetical protein
LQSLENRRSLMQKSPEFMAIHPAPTTPVATKRLRSIVVSSRTSWTVSRIIWWAVARVC